MFYSGPLSVQHGTLDAEPREAQHRGKTLRPCIETNTYATREEDALLRQVGHDAELAHSF